MVATGRRPRKSGGCSVTRARAKAIRRSLVRIAGTVGNVRWFQLALLIEMEGMVDRMGAMFSVHFYGPAPTVKPWTDSVRIPRSIRGRFRALGVSLP